MAKQTWLTCELVEELQQAAGAGQAVNCFTEPLENATLPALLEYGCARRHYQSLVALPARIFASPLGRTLQEVRSELGLRSTGRQKLPPRTMTPLDHEFFVLEGSNSPTTEQDWGEFLVRFRQSIKSVGFDLEKAKGIAAALGEMADNATVHANAPVGVLVVKGRSNPASDGRLKTSHFEEWQTDSFTSRVACDLGGVDDVQSAQSGHDRDDTVAAWTRLVTAAHCPGIGH